MTAQRHIQTLLVREIRGFQRELELFPGDEAVWATLPGITNPAGTLALHVSGNLQYFVGGVLGKSGYVRDREREFSLRAVPRVELYAELDAAAHAVEATMPGVADAVLDAVYPEPIPGEIRLPTRLFLLHLCVHAAFHLGQAGYLRRALTGEVQSSGAIPLRALAQL